jgi:hypothetical protein
MAAWPTPMSLVSISSLACPSAVATMVISRARYAKSASESASEDLVAKHTSPAGAA